MSGLRLYRPEASGNEVADHEEPVIFHIDDYAALRPTRGGSTLPRWEQDDTVDRARILHLNRRCPYCKHPVIEPLELNDGLQNSGRSRVPGTATLVGFQCGGCYQQWPA